MKYYICEHCGNIIEYVKQTAVPVMCCGQKMTELVPGTSDGAHEKHVPVVTVDGDKVVVEVGAVEHPMVETHYIQWIAIETTKGIGPGLSQTDDIGRLVSDVIEECECPLIVDADALNVISPDTSVLKRAKCPVIITPHIGEFARLCKKEASQIINNPSSYAKEFAQKYGCIVVLKSHRTVVASPDGKVYANILGNPGMASGGTGDVLAGAIASFASQRRDALLSALAGVYFHSLAADIACAYLGEYSLIAGDIINCLPYAIKETQEN